MPLTRFLLGLALLCTCCERQQPRVTAADPAAKQSTPRTAVAQPAVAIQTPGEPQAVVASIGHPSQAPAGQPHRFEYRSDPGANLPKSVHVAGEFNGWSSSATPMTNRGDGVFQAWVRLPEGVHFYKFVLEGNRWITDPNSDHELEQPDGYGANNSAVLVGPDGRKLPPAQPDEISPVGLGHDPNSMRDRDVASNNLVRLMVRTQADDITAAYLLVQRNSQAKWERQPLWHVEQRIGFDRFGTLVSTDSSPLRYVFELMDGSTTAYLATGRIYGSFQQAARSAYACEMRPEFQTPDWAKHAVWYQIFPERFRNGDSSNDPPNTKRWQANWFAQLPGESGQLYHDVWKRRYGGDFQGIREALPYLRKLGITAIYLNPIFEGEDLHKYDTSDFRHVDDNFGFKGDIAELKGEADDPSSWQWTKTDKLFLDFVDDAHRQGFKVIIDGVFNHVGRAHYMFQDIIKNGKSSRYADWFEITDFGPPLKYRAWDGPDGALPVFKKDARKGLADGPRQHILAITRRWLAPDGDPSRGVDGFRLDVAGDIPHPFWIEWRKLVKSMNPDAYICGEIWTPAQPWLQGDQFDAVMNYPFAKACQQFFVNQHRTIGPRDFGARLNELVNMYAFQVALVQQNLFDSHDTDRFASMFVNPDLEYDGANRIQDNGPNYKADKPTNTMWQRMRQATALQMTFVGAPMIYYGNEAGMWSPDDPSNRQPMVWQDLEPYDDPQVGFDEEHFGFYQRAIAARAQLPALRLGFFRTMLADDEGGVYAFARDLNNQHVYVAINRSASPQTISLAVAPDDRDATLTDWMDAAQVEVTTTADETTRRPALRKRAGVDGYNAENGTVTISLPAWGTAVLSK